MVAILRIIQQDIIIILDLIEIDLESLSVKLKNNRFTIESEIKEMLHFSENIGKSLNKKQYLVLRLYAVIFAQKKIIYGNFSKSIANLIWQL
jgi:hypothetical protein